LRTESGGRGTLLRRLAGRSFLCLIRRRGTSARSTNRGCHAGLAVGYKPVQITRFSSSPPPQAEPASRFANLSVRIRASWS
jgi:hypothetical protein